MGPVPRSSNLRTVSAFAIIVAVAFLFEQAAGGTQKSPPVLRNIPDQAVLEGSVSFGGIQPDYIIDKSHPELAVLWEFSRQKRNLPVEQRINAIVRFIREEILPGRDYLDPRYLSTLSKYRQAGREISIGEYASTKAGVCREYALLTHLALKEAGIPNRYVYAKVNTDGLIEDHAFTVVRHNGKLVSVDSYELDYSGRLLEDLTGPKGIRTGSYLAPWGRPVSNNRTVAVLEFHDFPKVWPLAPKMPESSSFVPARRLEARTTSIKIGPELTFTNDEMVNAEWMMSNGDVSAIRPENQQALEKFKIRIQAICKQFGCKVEGQFHLWPDGWRTPEVKVVYPDGWWFIAGLDTSVLEFQAKEMSLGDLSRVKRRIEEHIFETCKDIGLKPRSGVGGGHIHIDLTSAFPEDGKLLRDFIVDYSNHPGLAYGALTMDRGNATPIAKLRPDQKIAFRKVISDFDHGIIKGREQLATELERRVYFRSPAYGEPPQKYMAVNLTRVTRKNVPDSFRTVELRALRAQQSADDLEKLGELFERRINFLKSQPERVPVGSLSPPGSDAEVYSQFRSYVEGPGLDFSRFENLLPEKFRKAGLIDPSKCTVRWLQSILASP